MNRDAALSQTPLQVARAILARERVPGGVRQPEMVRGTLELTCLRVAENLRDALGDDGCNALLARALARTETQHPTLRSSRSPNGGGIHLDRLISNDATHDVAAIAAGIEALLAALIEILGRLIGEDMAIRLIDHEGLWHRTNGGGGAQAP
jgi:hypothetical protein